MVRVFILIILLLKKKTHVGIWMDLSESGGPLKGDPDI